MMEPDPKEFDKLQKLLASKEKEKPEEGFFDRFSDQVLTRLEEPAPKPTLWERLNDRWIRCAPQRPSLQPSSAWECCSLWMKVPT